MHTKLLTRTSTTRPVNVKNVRRKWRTCIDLNWHGTGVGWSCVRCGIRLQPIAYAPLIYCPADDGRGPLHGLGLTLAKQINAGRLTLSRHKAAQ